MRERRRKLSDDAVVSTFAFVLGVALFSSITAVQTITCRPGTVCNVTTMAATCHCLNSNSCDVSQGICIDYQCDLGWGGPPECQTACDGGTFGSKCAFTCHCRPNDTCSIINGYCSGGCDLEWGGTACQKRIPKLTAPPDIDNITCASLYVIWKAWNQATDIGVPQSVATYTLQQRANYTTDNATVGWSTLRSVPADASTQYSFSVPVADPYSYLEFQVVTNWYDFGKVFPGLPSPSSSVIRPITFCADVPGPVTSLVAEVQPQTSSVRFSWSSPANMTIGLTGYNVSYGIVGIGDCNSTYTGQWVSSVALPSSAMSFTIYNTEPWRKYLFVINALNAVGSGTQLNTTIVSQEIKPVGTVKNLLATSVSSRQVSIVWDDVACEDRGGIMASYEATLSDPSGVAARGNVSQRSATFTDLTPFTRYSFTVRYFNRIGSGPSSVEYFVNTLPDVPSAPRNILVPYATDTLLQVTWSTPISPNGVILQYRVSYWRRSEEGSIIQTTLPASQTTFNITGLAPYTVYCVQVQAQTNVTTNEGWGNRSNTLCNQTMEGFSGPPINLQAQYKNESCIHVQWNAPIDPNGFLISYRVSYLSKSVPDAGEGEVIVSTSQLDCWLCSGLQPDVQYSIQVQARTSRGNGTAASIDVWTEIGQPERPPVPQIVTVGNTTVLLRIEPAVLSHGPVTAYFIVVSLLQGSPVRGRRKRAIADDPAKVIPLPGYTTAQLAKDDVKQPREFIIGDNVTYAGYANWPLDVGSWYTVYYVVASSRDGVLVKMNYTQTPTAFQTGTQKTVLLTTTFAPILITPVAVVGGLSEGGKAAIGVLVPLFLIALVLLLLYCCWWRKRKRSKEEEDKTWINYYMTNYTDPVKQKKWNDVYSLEEPRYVVTDDVTSGGPSDLKVTDIHHQRPTISFEEEYRRLPVGLVFRCSEAEKIENEDKNRFDHLAYDHTRVKLADTGDGSDYYNANYIPGYDRRLKAYIAAQSPFNERTICDFWLMVHEQSVTTIVFVAQLLEDCIVKSEKYWSDDHLTHTYGRIAVALVRTETYSNFVIRTFSICKVGHYGGRRVTQFQFTAWPEHGVPDDPFPLLEFRRKVGASPDVPLLVHCGTGVSRSAVYIAIDYCLAKAEAENSVNVYRCCSTMRQCRTMMVRTLKQYIFIYNALFEALITKHLVVDPDVKGTYDVLRKTNPSKNMTHFKEQFHLLEKYLEVPTEDQCKTALSRDNVSKNRFSTLRLIVKDSDLITMRSPSGPIRLAYINALSLNSHTHRGAFTVTQNPLEATVGDFWNLIYDQRVRCIVALNGRSFREDTCVDYLPSVSRSVQKVDGGFFLTLLDQEQSEHVTIRTLQLAKDDATPEKEGKTGKKKKRLIKHYQFQAWNMYEEFPWSREGLLQLMDLISKERSDELYSIPSDASAAAAAAAGATETPSGGRLPSVVVHCIDGASQSGIFCACYVICQKMELDREVDVFHTIQQMKSKRFHFINTVEQYKFCFKLLWDFVNTRMTPSGMSTA